MASGLPQPVIDHGQALYYKAMAEMKKLDEELHAALQGEDARRSALIYVCVHCTNSTDSVLRCRRRYVLYVIHELYLYPISTDLSISVRFVGDHIHRTFQRHFHVHVCEI